MILFLTNIQLLTSQDITDGLDWCELLWCFYQLFGLSFWRHPFTAEDPLVSKWSNATFSKSDEETNSFSILDILRASTFLENYHFYLKYLFIQRYNTNSIKMPSSYSISSHEAQSVVQLEVKVTVQVSRGHSTQAGWETQRQLSLSMITWGGEWRGTDPLWPSDQMKSQQG